jgi:protein arginine kinase activator
MDTSQKICQSCGRRPAAVEFIQVTGEERRELSLCRECALSVGVRTQMEAFQRLTQLLMSPQGPLNLPDEMKAALGMTCSRCGLVFEEFVHTGLLGCPQCYEDFREQLKPALRRMHGVTKQALDEKGEALPAADAIHENEPSHSDVREQIEMELHLALLEEDYEKAAALRDKLRHWDEH